MNQKEQRRLMVLNQFGAGKLVGRQAAEALGLSLRHTRRIMAEYRREGAKALAHGNRGRRPHNAMDAGVNKRVVELARTTYAGCNTVHFTELMAEREGVRLSRSAVRRILRSAGVSSPRKRRAPRHRSRRERYPQQGQLLQIDGSPHDWLEGRGPRLTLIGAIDDATGTVPYALFRKQEDSQGYFLLLKGIVAREGIPVALYHDRHSIFDHIVDKDETIEEQLEGARRPTQFGRLMDELGIVSIPANSPQAKGRIERLWGTFQDRLVSELRLARACTCEQAVPVLERFLTHFNTLFGIPAAQEGSAYVKPDDRFVPDEVFCFKYERTVGSDNVVRFGKYRLQVAADEYRASYARAKVLVHQRMDGSLAVYYQGRCLVSKPAPKEAPVLRARDETPAPAHTKPVKPTATPHGPVQTHRYAVSHGYPGNASTTNHPWRAWVHRD